MADEQKSYKCESCGGIMEWSSKHGAFECPNCGNIMEIENDSSKIKERKLTLAAKEKVSAAEKTSQTMECKGCGASIEVGANETAGACPYCGSSYVLSNKQIDVITPDGIIPFTIDKVKLNQVFSAWIKGRWLA
ncbi:MAG: hypothetical protein K6G11_10585, partial [Lachnospiraceae bacterium]|nr:hypothetical protein [Lachnospiraceae bacterium]